MWETHEFHGLWQSDHIALSPRLGDETQHQGPSVRREWNARFGSLADKPRGASA